MVVQMWREIVNCLILKVPGIKNRRSVIGVSYRHFYPAVGAHYVFAVA